MRRGGNTEARLFQEEVRQRTRIALSARHKKGLRQGGACSLPSDSLTEAEWRRQNGPVVIRRFQRWREAETRPATGTQMEETPEQADGEAETGPCVFSSREEEKSEGRRAV